MKSQSIERRLVKDIVVKGIIYTLAAMMMVPLIIILVYIFKNGWHALNWDLITELPKPVGEVGGGVSNAIVGTLMLIGIATGLAVPIGIFVGIFMVECKDNRFARFVDICVDILQGTPSIVIGIIAYFWVVKPMGGFSAISGGIALSIMMLPMIIKSCEETLLLVPDTLKEAALGLGIPYYKTMLKVMIPACFNGIITGICLGIARIAGETAPLLFTAFGNPFMTLDATKPINALPLIIFNYATSPYEEWQSLAWGASLLLILMVLSLNIFAKVVIRK